MMATGREVPMSTLVVKLLQVLAALGLILVVLIVASRFIGARLPADVADSARRQDPVELRYAELLRSANETVDGIELAALVPTLITIGPCRETATKLSFGVSVTNRSKEPVVFVWLPDSFRYVLSRRGVEIGWLNGGNDWLAEPEYVLLRPDSPFLIYLPGYVDHEIRAPQKKILRVRGTHLEPFGPGEIEIAIDYLPIESTGAKVPERMAGQRVFKSKVRTMPITIPVYD
jgi:hypothetical protein